MVLVLAATLLFPLQSPEDADRAGSFFLANKSSIPNYRCRWVEAHGRATSSEEAVAKGPVLGRSEMTVEYCLTREGVYFRCESDSDPTKGTGDVLSNMDGKAIGYTSPFLSNEVLSSNSLMIRRTEHANIANVRTKSEAMLESISTPWNLLSQMSSALQPDRLVADVESQNGLFSCRSERSYDQQWGDIIELHFSDRHTSRHILTHRLAVDFGHFPVHYQIEDYTVRTTELRELAGGRFFPMRLVAFREGDFRNGDGGVVREIEVQDVVFGNCSLEDARLVLPQGTRVYLPEMPHSGFRTQSEELVSLEDLPLLVARANRTAEKYNEALVERANVVREQVRNDSRTNAARVFGMVLCLLVVPWVGLAFLRKRGVWLHAGQKDT